MTGRAWLTPAGTVAAVGVGAACATGAGPQGVVLLLAFFLSSTLLTQRAARRRNAWQVLANGGVAAAGALLVPLAGTPSGIAILAGALAAATADTWATEIGARSPTPPRHLLSWRPVPAGTSGGITMLGTAGGVLGALVIALLAGLLLPSGAPAPVVALAGVAGMAADSLVGAAAQGSYRCSCGAMSEVPRHGCGGTVALEKGVRWINNDVVNLVGTAVGGAAAWAACC
jgi:uncharacterized protein (TIGR00297 family)